MPLIIFFVEKTIAAVHVLWEIIITFAALNKKKGYQ